MFASKGAADGFGGFDFLVSGGVALEGEAFVLFEEEVEDGGDGHLEEFFGFGFGEDPSGAAVEVVEGPSPSFEALEEDPAIEDGEVRFEVEDGAFDGAGEQAVVFGKLLSAESIDEAPDGGGGFLVETYFPVLVAGGACGVALDELMWDKVVVGHDIGGEVAEVAPREGLLGGSCGFFEDGEADVPVVTMFLFGGEAFGHDHVGGHISVEVFVGVCGEKTSERGGQ